MTTENTPESHWRKRIEEVGKKNFELEEMVRLGFIQDESEAQNLKKEVDALSKARKKLIDIQDRVDALGDIQTHIEAVRKQRIERVKREREFAARSRELIAAVKRRNEHFRRANEPTFFGHGVSANVTFTGGDEDKLVASGLPVLRTFIDVADWLGIAPNSLQWLTYHRDAQKTENYIRFSVPKKSGGQRVISTPKPQLKEAQNKVLRNLLDHTEPHEAATAFRSGVSIAHNARIHSDSSIVVKMDIKDFFPSLTFGKVHGLFKSFGYNHGVSTVLALLCTEAPRVPVSIEGEKFFVAVGERALPQGAPTSPSIANQAVRMLDVRCQLLAEKLGWNYSRYADDLVFSTSSEDASPHRLIRVVTRICSEQGLEMNSKKTRVMRAPNRQTVTGLLVNEGVKLTRRDLRRLRAFFHQCRSKGLDKMSLEIGKDALNVGRGYHAYVHMIDPKLAKNIIAENPWLKEKKK